MVLLNSKDGDRKRDGHDTHPKAGNATQLASGAAGEDERESKTIADTSARNTLETDEYQHTAFETSNHVFLVHLSASCGDVAGLEFLLDVLASDAHTILSACSPLESCFGGFVPLQTLLAQEHSTVEETADFLNIGDMILESIGAHGSSACGQKPKSCIDLTPWFCVKVVQRITRRDQKVLIPGRSHYRFLDDLESNQCFPLLERFLKTWIAHLPPSANPRGLLMPMLDAIVRGFGEVKAELLESHLPQDEKELEPMLKVHSRYHIDLGFILVQSLGTAGLDDMLELLLFNDPFLQDDIAGFKDFFFQEYNI